MLLPLTLSSTAQTPLRWNPAADSNTSATRHQSPTQPQAYRANLPARGVLPLAHGFDVAAFENAANALTTGERVPGMAMAIVQNGRVLSARGYGVTRQGAATDRAHTVFRLASLSRPSPGP